MLENYRSSAMRMSPRIFGWAWFPLQNRGIVWVRNAQGFAVPCLLNINHHDNAEQDPPTSQIQYFVDWDDEDEDIDSEFDDLEDDLEEEDELFEEDEDEDEEDYLDEDLEDEDIDDEYDDLEEDLDEFDVDADDEVF